MKLDKMNSVELKIALAEAEKLYQFALEDYKAMPKNTFLGKLAMECNLNKRKKKIEKIKNEIEKRSR